MFELSLTVAFLGGALSLLPGCGPALLPAFFGYTFRQGRQLILGVLFFALGFSLLFLPFSLGLVAVVHLLVSSRELLFKIVGFLLVAFGLLSLFNWHFFAYAKGPDQIDRPWQGMVLGVIFGLTSSACVAPIYGSIISLSSLPGGWLARLLLLLSFEAGMFLPLLGLAWIFEKYQWRNLRIFQNPLVVIRALGFEWPVFLSNLLAAAIFIPLGASFIGSQGGSLSLWAQSVGLVDLFLSLNDWLINYNLRYPSLDYVLLGALLCVGILHWRKKH